MTRTPVLTFGVLPAVIGSAVVALLWVSSPKSDSVDYPARAVTLLVPFAAGGPSDVVTRIVAAPLSRILGRPVNVENVVGSGGTIGALRAKRAAADGYTLVAGHMGTHAAAVAFYPRLPYNPRTDFEPVSLLAVSPVVVVARRDLPPNSWDQFARYVQENAHNLDEGHAGVGSVSYAACLLLSQILGVRPRVVPHDGSGPGMDALVRGEVDFMCDQVINVAPHLRAGEIKAYAIATPARSAAIPAVPTSEEVGLPQYQLSSWTAVFAPKGTPKPVLAKLNQAIGMALDDPTVRKRLDDLGGVIPKPDERTPAVLSEMVDKDIERWMAIVRTR